jgi:hypothetical protein
MPRVGRVERSSQSARRVRRRRTEAANQRNRPHVFVDGGHVSSSWPYPPRRRHPVSLPGPTRSCPSLQPTRMAVDRHSSLSVSHASASASTVRTTARGNSTSPPSTSQPSVRRLVRHPLPPFRHLSPSPLSSSFCRAAVLCPGFSRSPLVQRGRA